MSPEKQYRFTPETVSRTIAGALTLGGAALGFAAGHAFDSYEQSNQRDFYHSALAEVEALQADYDEATYSLERIKAEMPEACRVILEDYIPGGELALVDDDQKQLTNDTAAVDDSLTNKDLPCGDDPTQIRKMVMRLGSKAEARQELKAEIVAQEDHAEELQHQDRLPLGKLSGASMAGFMTGMLASIHTYDLRRSVRRRRDKREQRRLQQKYEGK